MKLPPICRTCMCSANLQSIFKSAGDQQTYTNLIHIVTGVQINSNDGLPQNMCSDCINQLNDSLNFRKQCQAADTKLRSIYKEENLIHTSEHNEEYIDNNIIKDEVKSDSYNDIDATYEYEDDDIKNEKHLVDNKPLDLVDNKALDLVSQSQDSIEAIELKEKRILNVNHDIYDSKCVLNDTDSSVMKIKQMSNNIELVRSLENQNKKGIISEHKLKTKAIKRLLGNECHDNNQIAAEICDSDVENKSLVKHVSSSETPYDLLKDPVTGKVSRVFCKLCNKEYSIKSIDTHMVKQHPGADKRKVKCELCDNYVTMEKLNRHRIMMHGSGPFMCRYCKSAYDNKEELINHVTSCTAKKRKRKINESVRELQECDICHKMMQRASLRMHKAMKHAGLKPACEHCGRTFGNKFRLKEHLRAKHGYEKFQCSYCDFQSASTMAMRNHERRHRGEKPFICEACGAKFHAAYLLTQHRHSHKTEKLIMCDLCPATFKANNSLHMHKQTCHSSSMYMCTVCCRYYKCRHYAIKHVRHVHRYSGSTPPLTVVSGVESDKKANKQAD